MGLFSILKEKFVTPVVETKGDCVDMVGSAKKTAAKFAEHAKALSALLALELNESAQRLGRKVSLLILALFMVICGYLLLWVLLTAVMAHFLGWIIALAISTGFHFLVAIVALVKACKVKVGPLAPATAEELKNDLTCLQMALRKDANS